MKEFNRPGNGNIWKNKHLIYYPNRIFIFPNNNMRENSNKNRKVFLLFLKYFFRVLVMKVFIINQKGFQMEKIIITILDIIMLILVLLIMIMPLNVFIMN